MNHDLNFNGMECDEETKHTIEHKLDDLLEKAPSDATSNSLFTKMKKGYTGMLNVISSQGKFVATAAGRDMNETIRSLFNEIHQQLKVWRAHRYLSEAKSSRGE